LEFVIWNFQCFILKELENIVFFTLIE